MNAKPPGRDAFAAAEPRGFRAPWWLTPALVVGLFVGAQTLAGLPFPWFQALVWGTGAAAPGLTMMYFLLIPFAALALVFVLWTVIVERRSLASMGFRGPRALGRFGGGFAIGVALVMATALIVVWRGGAEVVAVAPAWGELAALGWVLAFAVGFMVQASAEEVAFRGWMMSAIAAKRGLIAAVLLNSLVFALLHWSNVSPPHVIGLINVGLLGLYMSLLAVRERGIWGACGVHAGWNWSMATGFDIEISGVTLPVEGWVADLDSAGADIWSGTVWGPEGSIATTAIITAASLWELARIGINARRNTPETPAAIDAPADAGTVEESGDTAPPADTAP